MSITSGFPSLLFFSFFSHIEGYIDPLSCNGCQDFGLFWLIHESDEQGG